MIGAALIGAALLLGLGPVGAVLCSGAAARAHAGTIVYGTSALVCAVLAGLAATSIGAVPSHLTLPLGLPWTGAHFRLDALSAFFLFIASLGGTGTSLYAIGYGRHEQAPHRVLPFYPVFLGAMALVVLADDAFSFLFAWELMSLASWALVIAHHDEPENTQAGYVYLLMAAFSGFMLLLAFSVLAGDAGDYTFAAMRAHRTSAALTAPVLLLALLGAGSKAGLVPLHAWLPLAHPAAPSHVSALMSGVMTKIAVYAFIRIIFDLLGMPTWWAAVIVLVLGGATAVLGVLYALMQHDLKRLLAYHTVENIGIIFIGLGLAMAFRADGLATGAALALTAALFHVFNHAVFKSLLFFGAGAVLSATGQRDIERLGGLIHRMRLSSFAFLIGCAAISALPPLNGFVSEWLTFQAILLRPDLPQWGLKVAVPADGALLALAAALAAACFVKAYGIGFLGRPRSADAAGATEVDRWSLGVMVGCAALCLLAGIFPGAVIDLLAPVSGALVGAHVPTQLGLPWSSIIPVAASRSSYNGLLIFAFIASSTGITIWAIHRFASHAVRRAPAWDCGFPDPSPITQYTADSFAQPIRRVFGSSVFRTYETITMPPPGDTAPARIEKSSRDLVWELLYAPVGTAVSVAAAALSTLQFLTIRRYLSFVFVALVTLLLVLALWR
jgi:formate hydrogenlyase subunit 3/multisubunit Na+/H+ antiporter MnhD subunit